MLKVVDVVYHCHNEYDQPGQVLEKHRPTIGFVDFIKTRVNYELIRHLNYEGKEIINGVPHAFFRRSNAAWQIPFKTHRYIRSLKPDIVLIHGFIFPFQVIALRMILGKRPVIILQHHGDKPADSIRKLLQKIADRFVDAYLFTAAAIAQPWLEHRIIRANRKVIGILEASAYVEKMDKASCKQQLGLTGDHNFLWVGRLNENKDPLTILKAFAQHVSTNGSHKLFMVYQTEEMLPEVKQFISYHAQLHKNVHLVGKLSKAALTNWYNAADFFISGSHEEAAGYALLEAMSVGCIPVVTSIPAFKKITGEGKAGFLFPKTDSNTLTALLGQLPNIDKEAYAIKVEKHFNEYLGFQHIADDMMKLFEELVLIKR